MGGAGSGWRLGEDRTWRKGAPPRGWYRAEDGHWHPGTSTPCSSPTTTTSSPPAAASPSPAASADPLASCTQSQRTIIERGNHEWSWYADRFDRDGDGILCE